jgi:hypothetical protein
MQNPILKISSKPADFGDVWVHVQALGNSDNAPYSITVPREFMDELFDARDKVETVSWNDYLVDEVAELGSAMLGLYVQKIQKRVGARQNRPEWVIATLESVLETPDGLELLGRAIRFRPEKFLNDYKT